MHAQPTVWDYMVHSTLMSEEKEMAKEMTLVMSITYPLNCEGSRKRNDAMRDTCGQNCYLPSYMLYIYAVMPQIAG